MSETTVSPGSGMVKAEVEDRSLVRPIEPEILIRAHREWVGVIQSVLEPERDYGVIPGTGKKPTLLKPGAERLCLAARFVIAYDSVESEIDHDRPVNWTKHRWDSKARERVEVSGSSVGLYRYVVRCRLMHRGSGVLAGEGMGSASSMESKYIDRPRDVENTILKMAEKRALVAAVLNTLALSDRFTQDVEDMDFGHVDRPAAPAARPAARAKKPEPWEAPTTPEAEETVTAEIETDVWPAGEEPDVGGPGREPGDDQEPVATISPAQVRLVWARLHGVFNPSQIKQAEGLIRTAFGVDAVDKIPSARLDQVLKWIESQKGK